MENKYSHGKIYRIWNLINDEFYIGSTAQELHKRWSDHRKDAKKINKKMKLFDEMNKLGHEVFKIELVENYPCSSRDELHRREGEVIRELKPTLNSIIAGRSREEYYHENKKHIFATHYAYHNKHRERINEQRKPYFATYREANKDKIKQYYNENREQLLQQKREHYLKNREEILKKSAEKIQCVVCGGCYTKINKQKHFRTNMHTQALANE